MDHNIKFTFAQIRYIVSLYRLSQSGYGVKNVELASTLGLSKPSVHKMLKSLADLGIVRQESFGLAFFTDRGRALAQKYAFCYSILEQKMSEVCGSGAASEKAICGLLADMPHEMLDELYRKKAR
ncbi:MAG: helix-turn-helix domain-containing protein [Clostridia bacterium]|nr:helix-turn-helix domain-containing protein [Clostridia bacterium]